MQLSPTQCSGGVLLNRAWSAQPTQMPKAVSMKSKLRHSPHKDRATQSGAAKKPIDEHETTAMPNPSHQANSFWGAPTHSGVCRRVMRRPRAKEGDQRSPASNRISMSNMNNMPNGCSGRMDCCSRANTNAVAPSKNSRPAAARTARSLMTGTWYPGTMRPMRGVVSSEVDTRLIVTALVLTAVRRFACARLPCRDRELPESAVQVGVLAANPAANRPECRRETP